MSACDDYDANDCTIAQYQAMCIEIDLLRRIARHPPEDELWCPNLDICAICGDPECDGLGCIACLDPNDRDDQPRLEQIQQWIRLGRIQEQANAFLAHVENRA